MLLLLSLVALADEPEVLPPLTELLPETPSYTTARKRMYEAIYFDRPITAYCRCAYDVDSKATDLASCELTSLTGARAVRVEAEHVVAASAIGATRPCWTEGGRSHCLKVDPVFATAHNDLHNLFPVVGELNGDRSNFGWGLIEGEEREYGPCDFEVDSEGGLAEPPPAVRGDIARVHFYMAWMHGVQLSEGQRRLFLAWHQADPVSKWEQLRDRRIEQQQGNRNPFVAAAE